MRAFIPTATLEPVPCAACVWLNLSISRLPGQNSTIFQPTPGNLATSTRPANHLH